jgi:predicted enzyme related to lactoylglutathione lyase
MPERKEYAPGTPSWVDLQTTDQAAAKKFYGEIFGWTYEDLPMDENTSYSMAQSKGRQAAAIAPLGEQAAMGVPPHWNTYVTVSDVDATTALVEKAGGTVIMPPFDVMDAGRMSVIQDPTGAMINTWQAKNNIGASVVNEPGAFSWSELVSPDVPKAAAFYKEVFGWEANKIAEAGMDYTELKLNGNGIAGAIAPPMPGIPPAWTVYFAVDDTDATVEKVKKLGGAVMMEPVDIPPGRFAVVADPQGAVFQVIKLNPELAGS